MLAGCLTARRGRAEYEVTPLTIARDRRSARGNYDHSWQPTPAGSLLLAWGGQREAMTASCKPASTGRGTVAFWSTNSDHDAAVTPERAGSG